jgi:rare lipoprotein A
VLVINDRGPFIEGRILDLSYAAALELEMAAQGVARVQIEIISLPAGKG